jgi:hypothetical protein
VLYLYCTLYCTALLSPCCPPEHVLLLLLSTHRCHLHVIVSYATAAATACAQRLHHTQPMTDAASVSVSMEADSCYSEEVQRLLSLQWRLLALLSATSNSLSQLDDRFQSTGVKWNRHSDRLRRMRDDILHITASLQSVSSQSVNQSVTLPSLLISSHRPLWI